MTAPSVLIVDDDESLLTLLAMRLEASGFEVHTARSAAEALGHLAAARPQVAIVDLRLGPEEDPASDGMALFRRMRSIERMLPVIILTAHGSIPDAVTATREGAAAFLTKPFDGRALVDEVKRLLNSGSVPAPSDAPPWRRTIVTRNRAMLALADEIGRVGPLDATVLVTGASGTGKELIARAIHAASRRSEGPFVAINCAALPEALLESELFGHVKGSFSGATTDHAGLLRSAHSGTILLDEIGDMPLPLQAKLLRVLQERKVRPVGGTREIEVDVRVIAATHRDLNDALREGKFRQDLYYRLNVVRLEVPELDERREDIPLLAQHFARTLGARYNRSITGFAPEAIEALISAAWPGNVRQLMNVIEQCIALGDGPLITRALVDRALDAASSEPGGSALPPLVEARDQFERDYIAQLLKLTAGNVANAARMAGRNRTEFYRLMQKHGFKGDMFKE